MIQVTHYSIVSGEWIPFSTTVSNLEDLAILKSNLEQKHRKKVFLKHYTIKGQNAITTAENSDTIQNTEHPPIVKRRLQYFEHLPPENKEKYLQLQKLIFDEKQLKNGYSLKELGEKVGLPYGTSLNYYSSMLKSKGYKL